MKYITYEEWLKINNYKDTKEEREWFYCPDELKTKYIEKHQDWWDNRKFNLFE